MTKFCRKLHNWLGLLLVIQITLWFLSGLVMAIMPVEQVRGEHLRTMPSADWQTATISPQQVLSQNTANARLNLTQRITAQGALPVYQVTHGEHVQYYDATTGQSLSRLSETEIAQAASQQYRGAGHLIKMQLLSTLPQEVHQLTAPLWQLHYDDVDGTVLYVDPNSGSVVRVRTDGWRLFDFFWMLHIMDYDTRHNFNNPLLISFAAAALLFTLTGIVLLWQRYRPRPRKKAALTFSSNSVK